MLARLVGIVLGGILATSGYVVAGWGSLGNWATSLDLGPFEPHRPIVGIVAAIAGGGLVIAALLPARRKARSKPLALGEAPEVRWIPYGQPVPPAEPPIPPQPEPQVIVTPTPVPPPATPVAAPAPPPPPKPPTFAELRARLVTAARTEAWAEGARVLMAMKSAAATDEERALFHRDLGDFAHGQGRMDDAADAYENAVSFARQVRHDRPTDDTIELLAGALCGVGDVAEAEGRLDAALSAFEEALALRRTRGGREVGDPGAQRALSVNLERLADLREDRGHRMRALDLYRESYDIAGRLAAADPARFGPDLVATRARISELEAKISG
ncbi:tetratricopeptide repeat protein [Caulobacter sp. RHG1]|uniref:tetratricopeptide repeat protein n=1 Tax=Caulobacter sp. (strain RHG1) TaxID=2545762 RepID=UPI001554CFFA|nr:tetratricopeptide repeat protein [Caulobacter sp. RHG1]NQE63330.1 TPR domain protein [Caulobacter sp. RHG1]